MSQSAGFTDAFRIQDRESCAKAIRNGGIAALFSAAVTGIFAGLAFLTQTSDPALRLVLNPWNFLDVVLILALACFVFQKSRAASTVLVIYFLSSKVLAIREGAFNPVGVVIGLLFLMYYANAMRGTYIWHRMYAGNVGQKPAG